MGVGMCLYATSSAKSRSVSTSFPKVTPAILRCAVRSITWSIGSRNRSGAWPVQERSRDKNSKFCKIKMADGHHIKSRLFAISPPVTVWLTRNLVRRSIITLGNRSHDRNGRKFKMANVRHFENCIIAICQPYIIRYQSNLVCWCKYWFEEYSHVK